MVYNVYSFPDVKAVIKHSDVGQCNLHQSGTLNRNRELRGITEVPEQ